METKHILMLLGVVVLCVIPLIIYPASNGEEGEYFGGTDDASEGVFKQLIGLDEDAELGGITSPWEPPSGEIESLLFALQAAIGAIIIGYFIGYYKAKAQFSQ